MQRLYPLQKPVSLDKFSAIVSTSYYAKLIPGINSKPSTFVPIPSKNNWPSHALLIYLVIAVIAATLFPLWPAEMRVGVYYLSVGAGCFVASILLLAVGKCWSSSPSPGEV